MIPVVYIARVLKGRSAGDRRVAIIIYEMIYVGTVGWGWGRVGWAGPQGGPREADSG